MKSHLNFSVVVQSRSLFSAFCFQQQPYSRYWDWHCNLPASTQTTPLEKRQRGDQNKAKRRVNTGLSFVRWPQTQFQIVNNAVPIFTGWVIMLGASSCSLGAKKIQSCSFKSLLLCCKRSYDCWKLLNKSKTKDRERNKRLVWQIWDTLISTSTIPDVQIVAELGISCVRFCFRELVKNVGTEASLQH